MKKLIYILATAPVLFTHCSPAVYTASSGSAEYQTTAASGIAVGYETFYNELSPYGRWIDYPGQGYMWVPGAEAGFRPYASNGHWAYTNYGWTWVSGYNWGWAPFHYGRWMYEDSYGWMWLPGHEWAPAWVTWGQSGGYYGWAPLSPGININISIGGGWTPPQHYWNFVPVEHITRQNINTYVVNNTTNINEVNNITKNVTIINNNYTVANNTTTNSNARNKSTIYNNGPMVKDVERLTYNKVQPVVIREVVKPGAPSLSNNELSVYRPVVKQYNETAGAPKPAPSKVEAYKPLNNNTPYNKGGIQEIHQINPATDQRKPAMNNQKQPAINEKKPVLKGVPTAEQQKVAQPIRYTPSTEQKRVQDLQVNLQEQSKSKSGVSQKMNPPSKLLTTKEERQQKRQQQKEDKKLPPAAAPVKQSGNFL